MWCDMAPQYSAKHHSNMQCQCVPERRDWKTKKKKKTVLKHHSQRWKRRENALLGTWNTYRYYTHLKKKKKSLLQEHACDDEGKKKGASRYFRRRWDVRVSGRVCSSSSRTAVHTVPLLKDSLSFEPGSTWTLPVLPPALWSHEIRENDADYLTNKEDTGRRLIMRSSGSIPEENNQRAGRTRRIRTDLWQAALHLDNLFRSAEEKYDLNFADFIMQ